VAYFLGHPVYTVFQKTGTLFIFAITLCVVDLSLKYLAVLPQRKFATKHTFQILYWCVLFNCSPSRKHVRPLL